MDLALPDTPPARLAEETVRAWSPPALVHHCLRSYLFASWYGGRHGIAHDDELLFVSAMLHDLGLEPAFDNVSLPFEEAGGRVGWVFAAGAGWPVERRVAVQRAIVDHMDDDVDPGDDPEGHLLARATTLDISGGAADDWPSELRTEALARYPALDLAQAFAARFEDQAARKPESCAGRAVRSGVSNRVAANRWGL